MGVEAEVGSRPRAMAVGGRTGAARGGRLRRRHGAVGGTGARRTHPREDRGRGPLPGRVPGPAAALRGQRGGPGCLRAGAGARRRAGAAADRQGAAHRLEPDRVPARLRPVRGHPRRFGLLLRPRLRGGAALAGRRAHHDRLRRRDLRVLHRGRQRGRRAVPSGEVEHAGAALLPQLRPAAPGLGAAA